MSYKEFTKEIDVFMQELMVLNTKIKNNSGLGVEDIKRLDTLKHIIRTYQHLKKYPMVKLEQLNENITQAVPAVVVPSAPPIARIFEQESDTDPDYGTYANVRDIFDLNEFSDESSDDESDDVGNNEESENAVKVHTKASILHLRHVMNTKYYTTEDNIEDDFGEDDSEGQCEGSYNESDNEENEDSENDLDTGSFHSNSSLNVHNANDSDCDIYSVPIAPSIQETDPLYVELESLCVKNAYLPTVAVVPPPAIEAMYAI